MSVQQVRNPFIKDLATEPGLNTILHESGSISTIKPVKNVIPFSLDWMLGVPFPAEPFEVSNSKTSFVAVKQFHLPYLATSYQDLRGSSTSLYHAWVPWHAIPFAWASYCRRKTQISVMCVKTCQKTKLIFESTEIGQFQATGEDGGEVQSDPVCWRNNIVEFDVSQKRFHTFDISTVYPANVKPSSIYVAPSVRTGDDPNQKFFAVKACIANQGFPDYFMDSGVSIHVVNAPQRGLIWPASFTSFVFLSYAGTILQTIVSPSVISQGVTDGFADNTNIAVPTDAFWFDRYVVGVRDINNIRVRKWCSSGL